MGVAGGWMFARLPATDTSTTVGWRQINRQIEVGNFPLQHCPVFHATSASETF